MHNLRPDGVVACEAASGELLVTYSNDVFRSMLGLGPGRNVIGAPLFSLIAHLLSERSRMEFFAAIETGRHVLVTLRRDNDYWPNLRLLLRPVEEGAWSGSLAFSDEGEARAIESAVIDRVVPEAVRGRAEGGDSDHRLADQEWCPPTMSLRWRADGDDFELVDFAGAVERLTGHPPSSLRREPALLFSGSDVDSIARFKRSMELVRLQGRPFRLDLPIRHARSGTRRWLGIIATAGRDHESFVVNAVATDVTSLMPFIEGNGAPDAARQQSEVIKELEHQIREISHREQKRIGHDLHDGLGQELTGISLMLKTLEHDVTHSVPELAPRVEVIHEMVGRCIGSARALAQGLSPVHLKGDGFGRALSHLAANIEALYRIPIDFEHSGFVAVDDEETATDLYRIVQEALTNASKHSNASRIELRLTVDEEGLLVEVEDDGVGIAAENSRGMGLKIMRYRANMIGASLNIATGGKGGTLFRCRLPAEAMHGSGGAS